MHCIIVGLLFSVWGSAAIAGSPLVSQLQPGERLHVAYQSRGCFHEYKFEIDLERGPSVTARSGGRTVTLSANEVAGLDKLLQFYRSKPRGLCTTQDDISISEFRGTQKISNEHYVDGTCGTDEMKDITRLSEIAKKLGLELET